MIRECGECNLCCKLLPVRTLRKPANTHCQHQRFKKGCAIYRKPGFPPECFFWNCRWLVDDSGPLRRPDKSHYVIDVVPDTITTVDETTGEALTWLAIQIWVDPKWPDVYKDKDLRAWINEKAKVERCVAIMRFNEADAIVLVPPCMNTDGQWYERTSQMHLPGQRAKVVAAKVREIKGAAHGDEA